MARILWQPKELDDLLDRAAVTETKTLCSSPAMASALRYALVRARRRRGITNISVSVKGAEITLRKVEPRTFEIVQ